MNSRKHTITLIPGDGIGPDVTAAVVRILVTAGLDVDWESHLAGVLALYGAGLVVWQRASGQSLKLTGFRAA